MSRFSNSHIKLHLKGNEGRRSKSQQQQQKQFKKEKSNNRRSGCKDQKVSEGGLGPQQFNLKFYDTPQFGTDQNQTVNIRAAQMGINDSQLDQQQQYFYSNGGMNAKLMNSDLAQVALGPNDNTNALSPNGFEMPSPTKKNILISKKPSYSGLQGFTEGLNP